MKQCLLRWIEKLSRRLKSIDQLKAQTNEWGRVKSPKISLVNLSEHTLKNVFYLKLVNKQDWVVKCKLSLLQRMYRNGATKLCRIFIQGLISLDFMRSTLWKYMQLGYPHITYSRSSYSDQGLRSGSGSI